MSVHHVLSVQGSKQAQIKFNKSKYCTKAPFVIYADIKSIVKHFNCQVKQTTLSKQHKVCVAAAILILTYFNCNSQTVMMIKKNLLAEFLDTLIVCDAEIIASLQTNQAIKRLSAQQQEEYDNATRCYICCKKFF